ncbi:MAG: cation transporter [Lachnospiraceae bacterium]|nr:cation transporter [Lachnospiraceae bacterium]
MAVTVIIIAILVLVALLAVKSSIKHFKGEGGCCGGGSGLIDDKKTLDEPEIGTKKFKIGGMSCNNCRIRVERAINALDGAAADVELKSGIAVVHLSKEIEDDVIISAVTKEDYTCEAL